MGTARETLYGYLSDMLLVEREIHAAVRRQRDSSSAKDIPAAQGLLSRLEEQLDEHVAALKVAMDRGGTGESTVKSTLGAILGAAAGLFDRIRLDAQLSRMLRDDYAALSFASVCYEMLHTTALGVRDPWVADLAIRHLREYARSIMEIGDMMPQVLLAELHAQGTATVDPSVAVQAQRNVRAAWSSQSHGTNVTYGNHVPSVPAALPEGPASHTLPKVVRATFRPAHRRRAGGRYVHAPTCAL